MRIGLEKKIRVLKLLLIRGKRPRRNLKNFGIPFVGRSLMSIPITPHKRNPMTSLPKYLMMSCLDQKSKSDHKNP